ncbi:Niban-like protein 1 [Acipenser ruthenus]|uniref:Niban-like protein 1 n=1 Tax=Acipenser ruthenus TaxID=7906 RepID=A0A444UW97_ACIRT|nr:Niban-like protein 1 [Acipenser ruthenus]
MLLRSPAAAHALLFVQTAARGSGNTASTVLSAQGPLLTCSKAQCKPRLLLKQAPLEDKSIFSGNLFQYLEENKKWRNRFFFIPDCYEVLFYETRLLTAGIGLGLDVTAPQTNSLSGSSSLPRIIPVCSWVHAAPVG